MGDSNTDSANIDLDDEDFDSNFLLEETEYFSYERWKTLLASKNKNDITAIHVNIRSLPLRINDLTNTFSPLDFAQISLVSLRPKLLPRLIHTTIHVLLVITFFNLNPLHVVEVLVFL